MLDLRQAFVLSLVTFVHLGVLFEPMSGSGLRAVMAAHSWVTTSGPGTGRESSPSWTYSHEYDS